MTTPERLGAPTSGSYRSGFVAIVGRPNVGKSTLLNRMLDQKVSIVSDKPQTTRNQIRGVLTRDDAQVVFLDTPGMHKPRTKLGERLNRRAIDTLAEVEVVVLVVEAHEKVGPGDRFAAERAFSVDTPKILVVNKVDLASPEQIAGQLEAGVELGSFEVFVPVSAKTGDGVDTVVAEILARLDEGPRYYPEGMVTDQPEAFVAAERVREKLLARVRDEVPHSIAVTVDEIEERDDGIIEIHAVVLVERDSQKGIVIGKGGALLKEVGTEARRELEALLGAQVFLDMKVKVERDWQRREHALDRLGY